MKVSEFLQALQTFFFDFIGAVIPGSVLLAGSALALGRIDDLVQASSALGDAKWFILIIATYILGNVAVGAGYLALDRWAKPIRIESRYLL